MKYTAVKENHLYAKAYAKGKKYVAKTIVVYVLKDTMAALLRKRNPSKQFVNRIGLTATKKLGGAVQRNRCKRIIREAYRQVSRAMAIKTGFLVIIVAREACLRAKTGQIKADLEAALKRLDMIRRTGADTASQTREK